MTIKIFLLAVLTALCFVSCGDTKNYCTAQKDLLQIDNTVPVIPLNFKYSTETMEATITKGFDDVDSICGHSPVFLVPFNFKKNEIKAAPNATLLSFSVFKNCQNAPSNHKKSRYDLAISINQDNDLFVQGKVISRFELMEQLEKWYFGIPEEQEKTMKETQFHLIYNRTDETPPQDSVIQILHSLTHSYLSIAKKVAKDTYRRPICRLSAIEIKSLKEKLPFHISLRLKKTPVLPSIIQ